jgi:hypothetical protein
MISTQLPQRHVGFWYSKVEPYYPMPVAGEPWEGQGRFLNALYAAQTRVEDGYINGGDTRWRVQGQFLDGKATPSLHGAYYQTKLAVYRGWSECRICGQAAGNRESSFTIHGVKWVWPQGLAHYVIEHNVKPDDDFINMLGELGQFADDFVPSYLPCHL